MIGWGDYGSADTHEESHDVNHDDNEEPNPD